MNITVVGAGALGAVYGTKLAHAARVVFVVRDLPRAPRLIHIERINGAPPHGDGLDAPAMTTEIPADADYVLCAVRADQLDDGLIAKLAAADKPVLMLPPILHPISLPGMIPAMSGVIAYEPNETPHERRVRYWTPKSSPTLVAGAPDFVELLNQVGIPAEVSPHAGTQQTTVTLAFFPIMLGIAAAGGSIDRMINDKQVMKLGFAAAKETRALAKTVGELPSWANTFFKFASPLTAKIGINLGKSKAPEAFVYLEKHFGHKLRAQNEAMFRDIERMAAQKGIKIDSLKELAARCR
jgi:hypothetical protein